MDTSIIMDMISAVGFPIAMVIALGIFVYKLWQQSVTREEKLLAEITENRLVNEKAVQINAQFAERFSQIESDVSDIKEDVILIKNKL